MVLGLVATLWADAGLRMPALFSDHMVVQRNAKVKVWGWDEPGSTVVVTVGWSKTSVSVPTGKFGEFTANVPTGEAGGPYTIKVQGSETKEFGDVLIGDVWVCSGQSNMEWPLAATTNAKEDIENATQSRVRLFMVTNSMKSTPQADCDGTWKTCSPESVRDFSAVGYLFGKELNAKLNVPIGLIDSTWGGTEAELWTSEGGLRRLPEFGKAIESRQAARQNAQAEYAKWEEGVHSKDPGWGKWWSPSFEPTGWTRMSPLVAWSGTELKDYDGYVWFRGTFDVSQEDLIKGAKLDLGTVDDDDETWLNGEKIGATQGWNVNRVYDIPANLLKPGKNVIVVRVFDGMGEGGWSSDNKPQLLRPGFSPKPITDWVWSRGVSTAELPKAPNVNVANNSLLFNGMISPLLNYPIKGAIWYQGEANVGRAYQYRSLFPGMIKDWRRAWGETFPFYFVQIAPFNGYGSAAAAELREAQNYALQLPKTGVVVVTDATGNLDDIHPQDKRTPAHRLALWALARDYGRKGFEYSGPLYRGKRVERGQIRVLFDHAVGLQSQGGALKSFEVAGADRVWHPAMAVVDGESVIVRSDEVPKPVAARMGWSTSPQPNLFNQAGLPASPFRTDNWPGLTDKARW